MEVMKGVPAVWNTILDVANMTTIEQLATAMEYYQDQLIKANDYDNSAIMRKLKEVDRFMEKFSKHRARTHEVETEQIIEAEVNAIGQKPNGFSNNPITTKPLHPPADHVVFKKFTPEQKGGRPCRHCRSKKHWDFDCPHSDYQKKLKSKGFKRKPFRKGFKRFKKTF